MYSVLVVDDMPDVRDTIAGVLRDEGFDVRLASSRAQAIQLIENVDFSAAVLDVRLDESDEDNQDGLNLMYEINYLSPKTAVIILTGYGTKDAVQKALRPDEEGYSPAYDFLEKSNYAYDELIEIVKKAIQNHSGIKKYQPKNDIEKIIIDSIKTRFSEIGIYNILVEGLTDKQYLEFAAERYLRSKSIDLLENGQVRIIVSRGAKHLAPLFGILQPLKESGINFVVILDGDDVGRRIAQSMRQFGLQKNRHYFQLEIEDYKAKDGRSWDVEIEDLLPRHILESFVEENPMAIEELLQRGNIQKIAIHGPIKQADGTFVNYKLLLAEYVRRNAVGDDLKAFISILNKARKCMDLPEL